VRHLTAQWAALAAGPSVYVATFLVSRTSNYTPEDYLGAAVSGFADGEDVLLDATCTRGSLTSIRLRYTAPDDATAQAWAEAAEREAGRMAHFTDALKVRRGRRSSRTAYQMEHQPSNPDEYGAWIYDMTVMVPEDVYTRPDIYTAYRQWVR